MKKRKIAIACQGGGSQTAFTAGALKGLFDIEMSPAVQESLDYESKLDRSPEHIRLLVEDGEQQAAAFLAQRRAALPAA